MQKKGIAITPALLLRHLGHKNLLFLMRTSLFFLANVLLIVQFLLAEPGFGQTNLKKAINLDFRSESLPNVFKSIETQANMTISYEYTIINKQDSVTLTKKNIPVADALDLILKTRGLEWKVKNDVIFISPKLIPGEIPKAPSLFVMKIPPIDITGRILNEQGEPVAGATVSVKGSNKATSTDAEGNFMLNNIDSKSVLVISGANIETREIEINGKTILNARVTQKLTSLNEVVVNKGYYTTSGELNTGNVSTVKASDIEKQPVHNPLGALQGRVPGMFISQVNGLPGSNFNVQIRGINSITQGTQPLFIVDGVPFPTDNLAQRAHLNVSHPLNTINPSDIESIEVLKDADATAIYGSRGANGVVLITTKRSKLSQGTKFDFNVYHGVGTITHIIPLMNIKQYLEMRREAFSNDNIEPDISNAYDLVLWDQERQEDWKKVFVGNSAKTTDAEGRLYGGNSLTKFTFGLGYRKETTISPGDFGVKRGSGDLNISHSSKSGKFLAEISARYASNITNLANQDFFEFIALPPNMPSVFTPDGKLNWSTTSQVSAADFYAASLRKFKGVTDNLNSNLVLKYNLFKGLQLKTSIGYNIVDFNESTITPIASQDPRYNPQAARSEGTYKNKTWLAEPQVTYQKDIFNGRLEALIGASWQENTRDVNNIDIYGIADDALIWSGSAGTQVYLSNSYAQYRYQAVFARLNYNWKEKYVLNLSCRRDGSSRFGPGRRYANFGAIGTAWILSKEPWIMDNVPFISFAKIRGSYGITGNDQIGEYMFLDTWQGLYTPYDNINALRPSRLFNPDYRWEMNKKLEAAVDLSFFKDRVVLNASYFRNTSGNQLIYFTLPSQTGFDIVLRNFPAVVQNSGVEIELATTNFRNKNFKWSTSINITAYRNKLTKFPGIENTSYASSYTVGQPLSAEKGFRFLGVDPQAGIYNFEDRNKDNKYDESDYVIIGNKDPKYYGGINNTLTYKSWHLDFLFQFVNQLGVHPVFSRYGANGGVTNLPTLLLDRWRKPGDVSTYQKLTSRPGTDAYTAGTMTYSSTAKYTDASYVRLKNLSLSYSLPTKWLNGLKLQKCNLFVQAQNLLTISDYVGSDPETQYYLRTPPLRIITIGFQVSM